MTHTLFLTKDEQKLLAALPAQFQADCEVTEETGTYEDTEKRRMLRTAFLTLSDPSLKSFQHKAREAKTRDELTALAVGLDLSRITPDDLQELLFAIGSDGMSDLVELLLTNAKAGEELSSVAFISAVRNIFYKAAPVA